ncbi:DUF1801 domain-containing protein [Arthrobacter flavus]|uniref:DUF1801 domain-containing protein n=1 Tax=Arthrobacter flavus TaxID=95172 RepID=A0ABW4QBW8_9MICC
MTESASHPTGADPLEFVAAVSHPVRRKDAEILVELMTDVTGQPPTMWGPTIIGFGSYHYRYDSGREGDAAAVGFSPRKANLVLYGLTEGSEYGFLLKQLGKHKRGSSCLYINKLADIDLKILEQLIRNGYEHTTSHHDVV